MKKTFGNVSDDIVEIGFINKDKILEYVTEEDIFQLVFEFKPVEFEKVTSPFRDDNSPGCWFETEIASGKLKFRDFAYGNRPLDCFDAVQKYFKLPNFYLTLEFIKANLIDGHNLKPKVEVKYKAKPIVSKEVKILISTRGFNGRDKKFWSQFGISKQNLIDDKVFPVEKFKITNSRRGDVISRNYDICYAYTDFEGGRKKLYSPLQKDYKFLTNCRANDIGGVKSLVPFGRQLVISKSYKDCRVLKNHGLNTIWFQNEGMFPTKKMLKGLIDRFEKVVVFFDNDRKGIESSKKLVDLINDLSSNKARGITLPHKLLQEKITDPSDLYSKKTPEDLKQFLRDSNLYL